MSEADGKRQFLRHTLATLAYRGGKTISSAPDGFSGFRINETSRSPGEVLAHIGDLLDWALSIAEANQKWNNSQPQAWEEDVARFFKGLRALDSYLASAAPLGAAPERLFQGAIADALTHVGQIAMLRRMAGGPVKGENYYVAEIEVGKVGPEQSNKRREF